MPMTVIVTRDVAERTRGFLASVMPEPAPGVYVAGELSRAVRERVWAVVSDWHSRLGAGSVVMLWKDVASPGGIGVAMLGTPPRKLADLDGVLVSVW
jgi:CRISPR-associated protein Cas2